MQHAMNLRADGEGRGQEANAAITIANAVMGRDSASTGLGKGVEPGIGRVGGGGMAKEKRGYV